MNKLHKKYGDQGLSVIASTGEKLEIVQAFSVHHTNMDYKVYTQARQQGFPNNKGIPQAYIIGADGSLVWEGHPSSLSDRKIEEFLRDRAQFFYSKFDGASKSSINNILKKKYGDAYKYADRNKAKISAAQGMFSFLEKIALREMKYGKKLMEDKEFLDAYLFFAEVKKDWRGTSFAKEAEKMQKECKGSSAKKELDALEKLQRMVAKLPTRDKDKLRLVLSLKSFAASSKYEGTKAAEKALNWVKILESRWP